MHHFNVYPTSDEMAKAATDYLIKVCKTAIAKNGRCTICLSGGSTPKRMFKLLAQPAYTNQIDWTKVFVFWGDERTVPQSHENSNSGAAMRLLFDQIEMAKDQIFPIDGGTTDPATAAAAYEKTIVEFFGESAPVFDICFLGMGDDGHTASLFPFTDIVYEEDALVKEVFVEKLDTTRISLTPAIINQADRIVFLIGGENKAQVLSTVLDGDFNPERYPSQLIIRGGGEITFFLDEAAAGES